MKAVAVRRRQSKEHGNFQVNGNPLDLFGRMDCCAFRPYDIAAGAAQPSRTKVAGIWAGKGGSGGWTMDLVFEPAQGVDWRGQSTCCFPTLFAFF